MAGYAYNDAFAPVVQWIELEFPKLSIQVRFLSGAPASLPKRMNQPLALIQENASLRWHLRSAHDLRMYCQLTTFQTIRSREKPSKHRVELDSDWPTPAIASSKIQLVRRLTISKPTSMILPVISIPSWLCSIKSAVACPIFSPSIRTVVNPTPLSLA